MMENFSDTARFIPVEITQDPEPHEDKYDVTIISPTGFRIEGLRLEDAVALLRELS